MQFYKKHTLVNAQQFEFTIDGINSLGEFCGPGINLDISNQNIRKTMTIHLFAGLYFDLDVTVDIHHGDWAVIDMHGEFSVLDKKTFSETYNKL